MGNLGLTSFLLSAAAALLCIAGVAKARGLKTVEEFLEELGLGKRSTEFVARVTVILELGVGVLLLSGLFPLISAVAAGVIGVVFVVVQHRAMRLKLDRSCGCFGSLSGNQRTGWDTARAWVFLGGATAAVLSCWLAHATTSMLSGYATSRVLGFAVGVGCVLFLAIAEQSLLLRFWQRETASADA